MTEVQPIPKSVTEKKPRKPLQRGGAVMFPRKVIDGVFDRADVRSADECWLWKLSANVQGYGSYSWFADGRHGGASAHRVAWVAANGPLPAGAIVAHTCAERMCVNPAHLELVGDPDRDRRRFEKLIVRGPECWEWLGYRSSEGYGVITMARKQRLAHRLSYEFNIGPIPDGLDLDHLCRNRGCVNPAHLEPVTPRVNNLRGTSPAAANAKKTHCKRGHEFTRVTPSGRRICQVCINMNQRNRKPSPKALKKRATVLHSQFVRARDGRCVRCGKADGRLECMHVFSRRYAATRTSELNGYAGCSACHRYLTQNPLEHVTFFRSLMGDDAFFKVRDEAYAGIGKRMDGAFWHAEVVRLTELLAGVS